MHQAVSKLVYVARFIFDISEKFLFCINQTGHPSGNNYSRNDILLSWHVTKNIDTDLETHGLLRDWSSLPF